MRRRIESFTVILLYPDYAQQNGDDTFVYVGRHTCAQKAMDAARLAGAQANTGIEQDDFAVVACLSILNPRKESAIVFSLPEAAPNPTG
jgi:hypothetical protein